MKSKNKKDIDLLHEVIYTVSIFVMYISFWFHFVKYNNFIIIPIALFVIMAIVVPFRRRGVLYVWYRKELKNKKLYWVLAFLINVGYMVVAYAVIVFIMWIMELALY